MAINKRSKIIIWCSISIAIISAVIGFTYATSITNADTESSIINYDLESKSKYQAIVDNEVELIPKDSIESILFMDINTGEILAGYGDVYKEFEPGSIFKILTFAMSLKENSVKPKDMYDCKGHLNVDGKIFYCWNFKGHGKQTLLQGIESKCNIAAIEAALKIGKEKFYENLELFGLRNHDSGIELNNLNLAATSIGKGFTVTPLQMASSISALLNEGTLYKPFLDESLKNIVKIKINNNKQLALKQVASKDVTNAIVSALKDISIDGKISGIGGVSDMTSDKKYITSYVATNIEDDPKIVGVIVMNVEFKDKDLAEEAMKKIIIKCLENNPNHLH